MITSLHTAHPGFRFSRNEAIPSRPSSDNTRSAKLSPALDTISSLGILAISPINRFVSATAPGAHFNT